MRHPRHLLAACALLLLTAHGCGNDAPSTADNAVDSGSADTSPADTSPADTSPADASSADGGSSSSSSLRGVRYCEIIGVFVGAKIEAKVWGTQGLNLCPHADWKALDKDAITKQIGATTVVMNGPRYWLLDAASATSVPDPNITMFGKLQMRQLATIEVPAAGLSAAPYTEKTVNRSTKFDFHKGSEVYELTDPAGVVYVMQSWAQIVDEDLAEVDLPKLGGVLKLPTGWKYAARALKEDVSIVTTGKAVVLQDELSNTYSRVTP